MGRGDQVGGVRRSLGVSESLLRQSLLEIDTATFASMVSRGLLHGKTFLSRPLTVRIYFKFSVTQFDNVLCHGPRGRACKLGDGARRPRRAVTRGVGEWRCQTILAPRPCPRGLEQPRGLLQRLPFVQLEHGRAGQRLV